MSHYFYRNLQATEISKLQLIVAFYVVYILADSIHSDIMHLVSSRLGHFISKKTDMT